MGRLAEVVYANATRVPAAGDLPYDSMGRLTKLEWTKTAGTVLASDQVTYSRDSRVTDQTVDGVDAFVGDNFTYDAFGRLTGAKIPGQSLTYGYGTVSGCTVSDAGENTNRSTTSVNGGAATTYCYDKADRLLSTTDPAAATIAYDGRGNTKVLGAQTMAWDGADRHMATSVDNAGTVSTVTYRRDAMDRIVERTEASATVRYGHTGGGDSGAFTMTTANAVIDRHLGLLGGVLLTRTATAQAWDYPNIHGDIVVSADGTGTEVGTKRSYDPFGQALTGVPDNSAGNLDYGWLGSHQRPLEHAAGIATIEMGARPYVPSLGRFLSVDPVEAGSCNDYDYVCGDPVNGFDIRGRHHVDKGEELAPQHDESSQSGSALAQAGRAAEDRVAAAIGVPRNTSPQVRIPSTTGYRVPDFDPALTIAARGTVVEVKDVQRLSTTNQLRDLIAYARRKGVPLEIFTNAPAPTRGELADAIAQGRVILRPIP